MAMCRSGWSALLMVASSACATTGASAPGEDAGADDGRPVDAGAGESAATVDAGPLPEAGGGGRGDAADNEGGAACSSLPLCDDFDQDTPGTVPTGWTAVMGCNPNTQDTAAEGGGLLVGVDSSQHHSGQSSIRIVGGDSCGYYLVESSAFAGLGPQLYARFWVMFSSGPTQGHNGFLEMATSGGDHFRLGFQDDVVAWNAQGSDATLPDMDTQGTSQSVGTSEATWTSWSCMEFHIDETSSQIEYWFNGGATAVAGLSYDGGVVQGVDDQWSRGAPSPPVPVSLGLGWLGLNNQETVWFDDVALSSTGRIGCN